MADGSVRLLAYGADQRPSGDGLSIDGQLKAAKGQGWQTMSVPLSCFAKAGLDMGKLQAPLSIKTASALDMTTSRIALGTSAKGLLSCP